MKKINYKLILFIILVFLVGLASSLLGAFVSRSYLLKEAFRIPFFNEVSITEDKLGNSNLIIKDAKKVVIEQDLKVQETFAAIQENIVGLYLKKPVATTTEQDKFSLNNFYLQKERIGQGFIITNDGWIISSFTPAEIKKTAATNDSNAKKQSAATPKNYVVIANDRKTYEIDTIIYDKLLNISFWHAQANGLPVKQFAEKSEIGLGQQVIAINSYSWAKPLAIIGKKNSKEAENSDFYQEELVFNESLGQDFFNALVVNLSNHLVALIDSEGKIVSADSFANLINRILKDQKINRPSLGFNYLLLAEAANYQDDKGAIISPDAKGIAVVKGSPAEKAGLKAGDIILAINNIEVSTFNPINEIISNYRPGDEIEIKLLVGQTTKIIKVKLGNLVY
ncbi:MAG: S1C family serine protease [Candidatus Falkowbacteria bacterium]|nr:S1C family serine protease [Candidatus Falkowbacteria bacterium]